MKHSRLYNWCFKDKDGQVIISQPPNSSIITWVAAIVIAFPIPTSNPFEKLLRIIAFGAIFAWAWMELFLGVNKARRIMGAAVLIIAVLIALSGNEYLRYLI